MNCVHATNIARQSTLGERVAVADSWWLRLRGLLGRPRLQSGEGFLLVPCRAVHMAGMNYPLDVVFLNSEGMVMALYHQLPPGGRTGWHARARAALELPAGTLAATGTQEGDTVICSPVQTGLEHHTVNNPATSPTLCVP
jgi:uncharacterized membrane protein (UPF0127 family)